MRMLKLLGLAFMATLVFNAFSTATASALEFLTKLAGQELFTLLNLNSMATPVVIETKGFKLVCTSILGHGTILEFTDIAHKILYTLSGCEADFVGKCESAGQPEGVIKTLELDTLLVTTLNTKYGILVLAEKGNIAEFKCFLTGAVNLIVRGNVVGETPVTLAQSGQANEELNVVFQKGVNVGEPAIKDYWTLPEIKVPKLEMGPEGGKFASASLEAMLDMAPVHSIVLCHTT